MTFNTILVFLLVLTRLRLRPTRRVRVSVYRKGSGRSVGVCFAAPVIGPLKAAVIPKDRRRPEPTMSIPRSVADVLRMIKTPFSIASVCERY
jgi:hypothetical protein